MSSFKRCAQFNSSSLVFYLADSTPTAVDLNGTARFLSVDEMPVLDRLSVSMVLVHIKSYQPCGINLDNVHPKGLELFVVLQGKFKTAFVEENAGKTTVH